MSVPAGSLQCMPSRMVMHTLHVMLLGTTCSLLVLTEERRRRIRTAQMIADKIMDNSRRLNEHKRRYYSSTPPRAPTPESGVDTDAKTGTVEEQTTTTAAAPHRADSTAEMTPPISVESPELDSKNSNDSITSTPWDEYAELWRSPKQSDVGATQAWTLGQLGTSTMADSVWRKMADHETIQGVVALDALTPASGQEFWADVTAMAIPDEGSEDQAWDQIEVALQLDQVDIAVERYRKLEDSFGMHDIRLTYWVEMLQSAGLYELAVDEWARGIKQLRPSRQSFKKACQVLTRQFDPPPDNEIRRWHKFRARAYPERVLHTMLDVAKETKTVISGAQITRALDAFYDQQKDLARLTVLFHKHGTRIMAADQPSLPLRCMLTHTARAGDVKGVEKITADFRIWVGPTQNAMLRTKLLLAHAVSGDWDSVRAGFLDARLLGGPVILRMQRQDLSEALEAFMSKHTTEETEAFIRSHVFNLGLVLGPKMIDAVARMYAKVGDIEGLGIWIKVCIQQGFSKNRDLVAHLLDVCAEYWKYGRNSLMYLLMQVVERTPTGRALAAQKAETNVSSDAVLQSTTTAEATTAEATTAEATTAEATTAEATTAEATMTTEATTTETETTTTMIPPAQPASMQIPSNDSELDDGYHRLAQLYLDRLKRRPRHCKDSLLIKHYTTSQLDSRTAHRLWKNSTKGNWERALKTYNEAIEDGLVPSDGTVCLAMTAAVVSKGVDSNTPMEIITQAQQLGVSIKGTMTKYIMFRLQALDEAGRKGGEASLSAAQIQELIRTSIDGGMSISNVVLNRATRLCLRARDYQTAIQLCQLSAVLEASEAGVQVSESNKVDILSSQFNFSNLLFAFSAGRQYRQLDWVLTRLQQGSYGWAADNVVLNALKRAETRLTATTESASTARAQDTHEAALERTRAALDYVKAVRMFSAAGGREARRARRHVDDTILEALATDKRGLREGMHMERQWSSS